MVSADGKEGVESGGGNAQPAPARPTAASMAVRRVAVALRETRGLSIQP